jgi:hypothetical protein
MRSEIGVSTFIARKPPNEIQNSKQREQTQTQLAQN